ncbi:GGDEF domain-containing protein [Pelagibaculum spongiae]|uniref:diguanylate cyclase n=1 Tax=Pelagibaculum spongiae TaxID=2080658 RepID=A0A2V1GXQ9_9GAMM|nr:GGDEF domain-containing protein [Pelagibaculum spongiae]PVZ70423.1 hypothetical protein DC094_07475 [Pelagibaculum spongiae]
MALPATELYQLYYRKLQHNNRLLKLACLLTAISVVLICTIWDWLWLQSQPKILLDILIYRCLTALLPLAVLIAVIFTSCASGCFNRLSQLTIVLCSAGIAASNLIGLDYGYGSIMQPIMLVTLFGYFFTSLTWKEKILICWPLIGLTAWFDLVAELGKDQLVYDMVYLVLVNMMGTVSAMASQRMGLHNLDIQLKLEQLAETDPLTGLDNRYSFERRFEALAAVGSAQGVALAIADLDHFKSYNDCYGHMEGDQCLVQIANLLKEQIGEHGLVARMGGEEFILLLHGMDFEHAKLKMIKLIQAIKNKQIDHWGSDTDSFITMSLGMVWSDAVLGRERRSLMEMADRALYIAKKKRNCCVCLTYEQAQEILPDRLMNKWIEPHNKQASPVE